MLHWFRRSQKLPRKPVLDLYVLEDRVLLDGTAVVDFDPEPVIDPSLLGSSDLSDIVISADGEHLSETVAGSYGTFESSGPLPDHTSTLGTSKLEVILIDGAFTDAGAIIQQIQGQADEDTAFMVYQLSQSLDGVQQVSNSLYSLSGVSTLHIIATETQSGLRLGSGELTAQTLPGYSAEIALWQSNLTSDAEITIHGVSEQSSQAVSEVIESLAVLTGHTVAVDGQVDNAVEVPNDSSISEEVVFFSGELPDLNTLIAQWDLNADETRHFTYVVLGSTGDGLTEITSYLESSDTEFSSVHVVGHGFAGGLEIGSTLVTAGSLDGYSEELGQWQNYLVSDADLLLYGCYIADGATGRAFVDTLAEIT